MPRKNRKKSPKRELIPDEKIITAKKLIEKGKSKRYAAEYVGINEATLRKRLKLNYVPESLGRFKPTFTKDQEAQFAVHCEDMDERYYGITIADLRRLAYEFAEVNNIPHRFNDSSKMAGRDWVHSFLERNEHLTVRQAAPMSLARAIGFNRAQVERFYGKLKGLYDKYNFKPHRIYNMDETGFSTVPKKIPKVIARKGKKVVGKIVSAERGLTVTAVMCMSAAGHFVPPALIYPRKRPKAELLDNGPTGSICMVSDSGFINTSLFANWLTHFKDFVHPSKEDPVLLILDNHSSHISMEAVAYAREHNIVMLTIPPHGSHKMQPLDVAVHSPLKNKYAIECEKWMKQHPGRGITQYQIAGLLNIAYKYVATINNAESGFRKCGIYPYADDLFDETDFCPASVTDTLLSPSTNPQPARVTVIRPFTSTNPQTASVTVTRTSTSTDPQPASVTVPRPSSSTDPQPARVTVAKPSTSTNRQTASVTVTRTSTSTDPQPASVTVTRPSTSTDPHPATATGTRSSSSPCLQDTENQLRTNGTNTLDQDISPPESPSIIGAYLEGNEKDNFDSDETTMEDGNDDHCNVAQKTNKTKSVQNDSSNKENTSLNTPIVTVAQLSPLPHMVGGEKKRTRVCLKSEIITSSPYKNQLQIKKEIEEEKKLKKRNFKQVNFDDPGPSNIQKKKKLSKPIKGSKQEPKSNSRINKNKNKPNIKKREDISPICPICGEKYEDPPVEDWIQCIVCERWFHEDCTAYENGMFTCDFCDDS